MPAEAAGILEIDFQNPQFARTDDWAKAIGGEIGFPFASYEWTQVLAPGEEYDQLTLVGATGWMKEPHHSNADFPFTHPFVDAFSEGAPANLPPVYDWEFDFALDPAYEFLLAEGNRIASSDPEHARGLLGVEVDGAFVPRGFKAGVKTGDRVAVFGRWIVDTGHKKGASFRSEIHPPLLMACASVQPLASGQPGTRVLFTSRPYLVSQRFVAGPRESVTDARIYNDSAGDEGPILDHLLKEYLKVGAPIPLSLQVSAHPKIKSRPFRGVHLLRIKVRPPPPEGGRATGGMRPRLAVSFQFTVRSGCAVQVSSLSADDTVDVLVSFSDAGYTPPPLPRRQFKKWKREDFEAIAKDIGAAIWIPAAAEAGAAILPLLLAGTNPLTVGAILELNGIESHVYDPLPGVDINDAQRAVTRVWANEVPANAGIVRDNNQPFPVFGWLEATWQLSGLPPV